MVLSTILFEVSGYPFAILFAKCFSLCFFLLLGLIPLVGFLSPVFLFTTQAFYAGFGNLDYTLERHFSVVESSRFVRKYRFLAIGNGAVFMLLLMTGIGFLIAPPLATVAATFESVERLKNQGIFNSKQPDFV